MARWVVQRGVEEGREGRTKETHIVNDFVLYFLVWVFGNQAENELRSKD